jgi:hypothetical protein
MPPGLTSDEHINALLRDTAGVTGFTGYVAKSRSCRDTTWTVLSEAAPHEAERHRRALGDITPITQHDLWARAVRNMSAKPCKALGIDLFAAAARPARHVLALDRAIVEHGVIIADTSRAWDAQPVPRAEAAAARRQLGIRRRSWRHRGWHRRAYAGAAGPSSAEICPGISPASSRILVITGGSPDE